MEDTLRREDPAVDEQWSKKIKLPSIVYYLKKGGSHLNQDQPFLRFKMVFPKGYCMHKLLKVIDNSELRKSTRFFNKVPSASGSNNYFYIHNAVQGSYGYSSRDFWEKCITFEHEGAVYKYFSSVVNSITARPSPDKDTVRATTFLSLFKCYRQQDGKVCYESI